MSKGRDGRPQLEEKMNSTAYRMASATLALMLWAWGPHASADRGYGGATRPPPTPPSPPVDRAYGYKGNSYKFHHRQDGHSYPSRGYVAAALPPGHRVVRHHHRHYYFHSGVWYHSYGSQFVVVTPPIGIVVPVLPPFYTTVWVRGVPYYYANDVYYAWNPAERAYVVVKEPPESEITARSSPPEQLFVYPKKGQSEQQQADDRYACHRWAAGEIGFDPSQPPIDMADAQLVAKRADYQRAIKACLEAREYSVK